MSLNITRLMRSPLSLAALLLSACGGGSPDPVSYFPISGSVTGLMAGRAVVMQYNDRSATTVAADGNFTFPALLKNGWPYEVTVRSQPIGQTCLITNGSGVMAGADVTNVTVNCTENPYSIGVSVTGLAIGTSVVLQNNGGDDLTISRNNFSYFNTRLANGLPYAVTILTQPVGGVCTFTINICPDPQPEGTTCIETKDSGNVAGADVSNVVVACTH